MFKMITFNKTDMKRNYMATEGCSIFTAMKRAGVPVRSVGGDGWYDTIGSVDHMFSKTLKRVSDVLVGSINLPPQIMMKKRAHLIGKSVRVAWLFLVLMAIGGCGVEGVFLDKAYRICRGHDGIQSVNINTRQVACHDGFVKDFRTRVRG